MIDFFMLIMYVLFLHKHKELLCFQNPLSVASSDLPERENVICEWSVEKATKTLGFFKDCCNTLYMKKKPDFLWIKPEVCCWRKV